MNIQDIMNVLEDQSISTEDKYNFLLKTDMSYMGLFNLMNYYRYDLRIYKFLSSLFRSSSLQKDESKSKVKVLKTKGGRND